VSVPFGSMPTTVLGKIRAELKANTLPSAIPLRAKVGMGNGQACSGCDAPIDRIDTQWELEFTDGIIIGLHEECERRVAKGDEGLASHDPQRRVGAHRLGQEPVGSTAMPILRPAWRFGVECLRPSTEPLVDATGVRPPGIWLSASRWLLAWRAGVSRCGVRWGPPILTSLPFAKKPEPRSRMENLEDRLGVQRGEPTGLSLGEHPMKLPGPVGPGRSML
jgi:hypothetical protein